MEETCSDAMNKDNGNPPFARIDGWLGGFPIIELLRLRRKFFETNEMFAIAENEKSEFVN
jgi:hypothetical protein